MKISNSKAFLDGILKMAFVIDTNNFCSQGFSHQIPLIFLPIGIFFYLDELLDAFLSKCPCFELLKQLM